MKPTLNNVRVAVIVADGFEEVEFSKPVEELKKAKALVDVISLKKGKVKAWNHTQWGNEYTIDKVITEVHAEDYDALVLPGGVMNPDKLRLDNNVVKFATYFMEKDKPVAAICHGPWTLVETGKLQNRKVTSYPSIKTDLINAGAKWEDEEVIVDHNLVTSRKPADLPAFCAKMIDTIAESLHTEA
jgi:protease I